MTVVLDEVLNLFARVDFSREGPTAIIVTFITKTTSEEDVIQMGLV